ncbi:M61 glycyl aminopeptidase family protein [Asticcacaulis biprosthecium C19]|uniref:M61 glycyl aminopeptidase family protein n=1 Tax=Asticcacaulis biprosthecium C19 TaxID=715226 RepID=F4QRJ8_9CAUL|nr:M61 family metallopeptidase [Asticcacaulis biprosthecium]EGF90124.1 M61 glycyl aminopeptidase family protein [Asticcacaulis biprosthecium C19]
MKAIAVCSLALGLLAGPVFAQPVAMPAALPPGLPAPQDVAFPGTIQLFVDASDTDRHIVHIREVIPVAQSGRLTLLVPKWLPGHHSPADTDLTKIAGLKVMAGDKALPWTRDSIEQNAFHVDVPAGVTEVTAQFQYLFPVQARDGEILHTDTMMALQWTGQSLYPAGWFTRRIPIQLNLTLPKDWSFASALEAEERSGDVVTFKAISYDHFIDSPLIAGRHFRTYDLDPGAKVPVNMSIVADDPKDLEVPANVVDIHRRVVQETYKLFGAKHYDRFDFLVTASDTVSIGLEHHRSSEIGVEPGYFREVAGKGFGRNIMAHEYIHSWDGKFRRPRGQFTGDFQAPMQDELLWVYEGGTTYWTWVIEGRAGLYSYDQTLQQVAATMAVYDNLPARHWRNLVDTTYDPIISNREPKSWTSWQRSEDYYSEGALIWLEADILIRERTNGKKSLDDFARGFFGVHDGAWDPMVYGFDDVVASLNSVYPYDWATFLTQRTTRTGGGAPLDSLARAGYRLVYSDTPMDYSKSNEAKRGVVGLMYGPGLSVAKDGAIREAMWDGPAFKLGLTAGMKIVAVDGRGFTPERLKDALVAAHGTDKKIELWMQEGDRYRIVTLDYHDGLRYPRLERIEGKPDGFKPIFTAADSSARK